MPDDDLVRRLAGRRVCVKNPSHIYHVDFDPPKHEGVCDQDGARLIQREDDQEEMIRRRLEVYHSQTEPLIAYYDRAGPAAPLRRRRSADEVHAHIRATIATLRLEESCSVGAGRAPKLSSVGDHQEVPRGDREDGARPA